MERSRKTKEDHGKIKEDQERTMRRSRKTNEDHEKIKENKEDHGKIKITQGNPGEPYSVYHP